MSRTSVLAHHIDTEDYPPINVPPYRLPPSKRDEVERQIESMMRTGVVCPSRLPWSSPVMLVDKLDGSKRFCVDYHRVNACTKKNRYPIPRVDDSLDLLSGKQLFSSLDLMSVYWQLPIAPDDIEKTVFTTPVGVLNLPPCRLDCAKLPVPFNGQWILFSLASNGVLASCILMIFLFFY